MCLISIMTPGNGIREKTRGKERGKGSNNCRCKCDASERISCAQCRRVHPRERKKVFAVLLDGRIILSSY